MGLHNFSIIIPHRNTPDLLVRLLDSIPQRDDMEIIIVDDNSDINIVDFDEFPGQNRSDVKLVFNKEVGRGAGKARNIGIEKARGKWLLFADADDCYTNNLSKLLDKYANNNEADIVYLNACVFNENGIIGPNRINQLIQDYIQNKPYSEMLLRYSVWTPWSRMVKREIVYDKHLQFDEVPAANDKNFCLQCSRYAQSIAIEQNYIYMYYRPLKMSQTSKIRNNSILDSMIKVRDKTIEIYSEVGFKYMPSYFGLFNNSPYAKDIPAILRIKKYFSTIRNRKVSLIKDINRYILTKRIK